MSLVVISSQISLEIRYILLNTEDYYFSFD